LAETPTEEIVATLAGLNIQTDEAGFRELATTHGSPEALADVWGGQSTAAGIWEDYPWLAAEILWGRWTPDLFSVGLFVDHHLTQETFKNDTPASREEAELHWRTVQAVMDVVAPRAGEARPDLLDQMTELSDLDLGWWLGEMPFTLARFGMVEEAAELCMRMAAVREAENFLGDRAVILAEAGRTNEALRQVEENRARFPEDIWILIKGGDAYRAVGDVAAAEKAYRDALEMTPVDRPNYDRDGVMERLIPLLEETGRSVEADTMIQTEKARAVAWEAGIGLTDETGEDDDIFSDAARPPLPEYVPSPSTGNPGTIARPGPKVSRNDPCPCGSGKKFKRCCNL
jgi:hypothetical protein